MLIKDAYLTMYQILDNYYIQCDQNDPLGSLLSDMDPGVFSDGRAADLATYDDWYSAVSPFIKEGEICDEDITTALKEFLICYQEEFGYNLRNVIEFVVSLKR